MNNKNMMILAASLLVLASVAPVAAYHIKANPDPNSAGMLTSSDWALDPLGLVLLVCESDGLLDPRNANPTANAGIGGLCTSGRQDYFNDSCENNPCPAPGAVANGELVPPATEAAADAAGWTQLDVCDKTLVNRDFSLFGTQGNCTIDTIGFFGEIGVYACFARAKDAVFPLGSVGLTPSDRSLFYKELYAWWSYDGDGDYSTTYVLGASATEHDGFHGHVAVFPGAINRAVDVVPAHLTGSVYVANNAPAGDVVNCDSSPVANGPVVLADSTPPTANAPGLTAVVQIIDDGLGGGPGVTRVNPSWACGPLVSLGGMPAEYRVTCNNVAGGFNNQCYAVTASVLGAAAGATAACTTLSATAPSGGLPVATANDPAGVNGPFVCTVKAGTVPWSGECSVNP